MRKSVVSFMFAAALCASGCPDAGYAKGKLPPGTIQKGSLANHKLTQDTLLAAASTATARGCQGIESFTPYMVAMPKGAPGARVWREKWIFSCQGGEYPIDIRFSEAGMDAADYQIQ